MLLLLSATSMFGSMTQLPVRGYAQASFTICKMFAVSVCVMLAWVERRSLARKRQQRDIVI
jgi:hypothetical protein